MARILTSVLLLIMTATVTLAQTLTGSVRDADNQPASFAVIKLLRSTDSTLAKGAVADEAGRFTFTIENSVKV